MGRINPLRAVLGVGVGLALAGGTGVAVAQGGLTANLALSGTIFNVSMGNLDGEDFSLFVGGEELPDGTIPASKLRFGTASASDLCVSAPLRGLPGVGDAIFVLKVPGENTVQATDLVVGATVVRGNLVLDNPQIGIDASQVDGAAPANAWGIASRGVSVQAQEIRASSVGAGSLTASGFDIGVKKGHEGGC